MVILEYDSKVKNSVYSSPKNPDLSQLGEFHTVMSQKFDKDFAYNIKNLLTWLERLE